MILHILLIFILIIIYYYYKLEYNSINNIQIGGNNSYRKFEAHVFHSPSIKTDKPKETYPPNSYYIPIEYMSPEQKKYFLYNANFNKMTDIDIANYMKLVGDNNVSLINNLSEKELKENELLNELLPRDSKNE
jgi:hypothetical protein